MKKTEKTALTAALFAAAMQAGTAAATAEPIKAFAAFSSTTTTTTVVGMENVERSLPAVSNDAIKEFKKEMSGVYGPPPTTTQSNVYTEPWETTTRLETTFATLYGPPSMFTTTVAEPWETTTKLETTFATLYGPPSMFTTTVSSNDTVITTTTDKVIAELESDGQPVYGPKPFYGDVNNDGSTDVFDMILLREEFTKPNPEYSFLYDVNYDMKLSIADLVVLNKYLLGQINNTINPEDDDVMKTTTRTQPVYGAPVWFTTTASDDEEDVTTTKDSDVIKTTTVTTQTVYGPPVSIRTTVPHEEDVISTTQTTFRPLYGPPSVFE